MQKYNKAIVAAGVCLVGAAMAAAFTYAGQEVPPELWTAMIGIFTSIGVYLVPNQPDDGGTPTE